MNKKNTIIAAAVLVVLAGAVAFAVTRNNKTSDMGSMNHDSQTSDNTESSTYKQFAALKGEDFDRMFLADMMAHHQGAIDMANLAVSQAKHTELKTMAQDIISTQNKEITDMKSWQTSWGYPATSGDNMMDHSAMGMENDMAGMTNQLKGLNGDAFDKKFIELMIEHHQSAIDMARPAANNAQHAEVKILAKAIVDAQSKEIDQMKAWQKDWGY
jgi:uncharacterized protein (DUF305 family)